MGRKESRDGGTDTVAISEEARARFLGNGTSKDEPLGEESDKQPGLSLGKEDATGDNPGERSRVDADNLTPEEKEKVAELKRIDRRVRSHEMAHKAAGGPYVRGGPSFDYVTGPDGKRYAVGGSVSIDSGPASSPQATIIKARIVRQAAMAPGDMSGSDRQVAAAATRMEAQARAELRQEAGGTV
jgi:hypothetical protein